MNKLLKSALSLAMALALMFSLGTAAFAAEWNIENGDITVSASLNEAGEQTQNVSQTQSERIVSEADPNPIITGSSTTNTVTIKAEAGATANVTLSGVNIDTSNVSNGDAAISITGQGNVNIELDGDNTVKSADYHAGIEKNGDSNQTGTLTIKDDSGKKGTLTATGGYYGAGIGGGDDNAGENITITGGKVTATGGDAAAGIGGGAPESGENITITGGEVAAKGGVGAAGIGGGMCGDGTGIHITGGKVTATGGGEYDFRGVIFSGAGIGGGAPYLNISNSNEGMVIGDAKDGNANDITISNATVKATGGYGAAGIGGGATAVLFDNNTYSFAGNCTTIKISGNAQVTAKGGESYSDKDGKTILASGTAIGNGSTDTATGTSVEPDTKELTGWVELKNADGTLNKTIGDKPETPTGDSSSTGGSSATDSSSATLISMDTTSPESSPLPVRYYVVTGAEQTWLADSEDGLEFTLNSDSDNVVKVLIDGEEVEFEINDNGDIVISAEVLKAFESGAHEIEFVFSDGSCKASFTVK